MQFSVAKSFVPILVAAICCGCAESGTPIPGPKTGAPVRGSDMSEQACPENLENLVIFTDALHGTIDESISVLVTLLKTIEPRSILCHGRLSEIVFRSNVYEPRSMSEFVLPLLMSIRRHVSLSILLSISAASSDSELATLFMRIRADGLFGQLVLDTSTLAPNEVSHVVSIANKTLPVAVLVPLGRLVTLPPLNDTRVFYLAANFWVPSPQAYVGLATNPIYTLRADAERLSKFLSEPFAGAPQLGPPIPIRDLPLLSSNRVTVVWSTGHAGNDCMHPRSCTDESGRSELGLLSRSQMLEFVAHSRFSRVGFDSFERLPSSWLSIP